MMAEKTLKMTLLFDFFGDLLSERQREYFDLYYNEDLTLTEIAEDKGISRQGVRDVLTRARNALDEYEEKTGVVTRFLAMKSGLASLEKTAQELIDISSGDKEKELASSILRELQALDG